MSQQIPRKSERIAGKPSTKDTSPMLELHSGETSGKVVYESLLDCSGNENLRRNSTVCDAMSEPMPTPTLSTVPPQGALVESYLSAATDRFEQILQKSVDKLLGKLQTVEDNFAASLDFERKRIDDLFQHRQRMDTELSELQQEVIKLRQDVIAQKEAANKTERFSRRNNIRLVGIPESPLNQKDDCIKIAEDVISAKSNIATKVERAHRDGLKKEGKPRHILIKLLSYRDKVDIMKRAREATKDENYFFTDDLTKEDLLEKMKWSKYVQELYHKDTKLRF